MARTIKDILKYVKKTMIYQGNEQDKADVLWLVWVAYQLGRCDKSKELCDKAAEIFKEQHKRADDCRYHDMANAIVGNINYIYDGDYDQWVKMFLSDKVNDDVDEMVREAINKNDAEVERQKKSAEER